MKKMRLLTMGSVMFLFLTACGGGSSSVATTTSGGNPSVGELDAAKSLLNVQVDKTTHQPAMVGNFFVHLSDGTKEVFADKKNVVRVFFNGDGVGWHIADSTKGVDLQYDGSLNPTFTIAGQPLSPVFGSNFSFLMDDGRELSQITDAKWLTITVGAGMTAERKADGLIYGSSTSPSVPPPVSTPPVVPPVVPPPVVTPPVMPPVPTPTPTQQLTHNISVVDGVMRITLVTVDGFIVEIVRDGVATALKAVEVHRVFWSGDVAQQWTLVDSNSSSAALTLPTTSINVPVHDNGIIRIVDKLGGVYSINTAKMTGLQLTTDGRQLIAY